MSNSKKVNEKWSKKDCQKSSKRVYSRSDKAITLIALIVTIIVLLILAGVTINLAVNNQGIFNKAKTATGAYKNASEGERTGLDEADKEIAKYMPKEGSEGGSGSESGGGTSGSGSITYTDSSGKTQTLTKDTAVGTIIGTTKNISGKDGEAGVDLDWYLFDTDETTGTAYLVSTPTYWVPDTTKPAVSEAWVPKLVSNYDSNTSAMNQAIQKKASATGGDYSWSYSPSSVTYTPSANTLSYYKSVNSQWSDKRGNIDLEKGEFKTKLNENEQAACYLADGDIFAGIKSQVNNADGNLKGKIQTLVGGASAEQWCTAYNKQAEVKNDPTKQITCEYQATNTPGYIYKVNGTAQNSGWSTNTDTIFGNDIYGAAHKNGNTSSSNAFYNNSWWWLASPSSGHSEHVCSVRGYNSYLSEGGTNGCGYRVSLFASVAL